MISLYYTDIAVFYKADALNKHTRDRTRVVCNVGATQIEQPGNFVQRRQHNAATAAFDKVCLKTHELQELSVIKTLLCQL